MRVEIDQSGRIEETNRDTIIAFSNDRQLSIRIPRRVKCQLLEIFQQQGKPTVFKYKVFALGIVILLRKSEITPKNLSLIIDREYPGHEDSIRDIIWSRVGREVEIDFESVGKHSGAHYAAYGVFMGRQDADYTAGLEDLA
jgi:hypothetical protein